METANFKSRLYLEYNNPWGMKVPKVRKTTALKNEIGDGIAGRDSESFIGMFQSMTSLEAFFKGSLKSTTWAVYPSVEAGCEDIILWMENVKFKEGITSLYSFIAEMKVHGYFADESTEAYFNKVIAWENR